MRNIDKDSHWWLVISLIMLVVVIFLSMTLTGCTTPDTEGEHGAWIYVRSEPDEDTNEKGLDEFTIKLTDDEREVFNEEMKSLDNAQQEILIYSTIYTGVEGQDEGLMMDLSADGIHSTTQWIYYHQDGVYYRYIHLNIVEIDGPGTNDYFQVTIEKVPE